jgi:hypothetical protein
VQEILGDEARWSDTEYLLALAVDSLTNLSWLGVSGVLGGVAKIKNPPKKPPEPIRRPGDVSKVTGVTITRNVTEKTTITAGSLTLAELQAVVAMQTGSARGIEEEVD